MGRLGLIAAGAFALVAACGARTDMPLDEAGPVLLSPNAASGKAGAGGAISVGLAGAAGSSAGAGGAVSTPHPCGDCVATNGPSGCGFQFEQCSGSPPCAPLNACLVTNGCLEGPDVFACGQKFCPSFISSDVSWAPFGQCAVCLPACQGVCAKTGFGCASPPPPTPCAHGLCQTGAPLDPSCDPCVAETCQKLPQCCNPTSSAGWTPECAMVANAVCGACLD